MREKDAAEGVEVDHAKYGRGVVTEHRPQFGAEPDRVRVRFHDGGDERTLPVYEVDVARKHLTLSAERGVYGFQAVVDDGHGTVVVEPDGSGEGYTVELRRDGETRDAARLAFEGTRSTDSR